MQINQYISKKSSINNKYLIIPVTQTTHNYLKYNKKGQIELVEKWVEYYHDPIKIVDNEKEALIEIAKYRNMLKANNIRTPIEKSTFKNNF